MGGLANLIRSVYAPLATAKTVLADYLSDEMAAIDSYHINFLGDLPAIPSAYIVTPLNPVRVFAGVEV